MGSGNASLPGVLYLITSGAPASEGVADLAARCQAAGWQVFPVTTPHGARFLDLAALESLTGEPVRAEYRMPGEARGLPPADAVLACPLTFNSVNKFAHGHADNFAVGLLCELAGYRTPMVAVPHCKPQLASHPAFTASIAVLRGMGVTVLYDPAAPYERQAPAVAGCRGRPSPAGRGPVTPGDARENGQRIARARRRRGLSQAALAGLVGRSESWLSQVERGIGGRQPRATHAPG